MRSWLSDHLWGLDSANVLSSQVGLVVSDRKRALPAAQVRALNAYLVDGGVKLNDYLRDRDREGRAGRSGAINDRLVADLDAALAKVAPIAGTFYRGFWATHEQVSAIHAGGFRDRGYASFSDQYSVAVSYAIGSARFFGASTPVILQLEGKLPDIAPHSGRRTTEAEYLLARNTPLRVVHEGWAVEEDQNVLVAVVRRA
jgi:hypothetical protein